MRIISSLEAVHALFFVSDADLALQSVTQLTLQYIITLQ